MTAVAKGAARAVADLTEGVIFASVEVEAPPERVFRALASEELAQWWGSPDLYRVTRWTGDVRKGGKWKSEGVSKEGRPFSVSGEFLEVEPPHLLVQTWTYDWDAKATTKIRYRIDAISTGSRITVRHEGFAPHSPDCESHASGWERVLGWLGDFLRER
jgi:uncharacterized protein YndB with AHSA1/START domain